jgi:hypothetical protein
MYGDGEWDEDDVEEEEKNRTNQLSPTCTLLAPLHPVLLPVVIAEEEKHHKRKDSPAERLKSTRKTIALAQETLYP